ncbi:MAG: hypothetical protein WBM41_06200 [Arenicellales bacterium]
MIKSKLAEKTLHLPLSLIAVLLASAMLGGCAQIRKATYPPDFVYLEKQEVRTSMQKMAISIGKLDRLLSDTEYQSSTKKEDVNAELTNIEDISRSLNTGGNQSNHPVIAQHMENFRDQLSMARRAAQADPPDYYPAGRLVGQCQGCHIQR